MIRGFDWSNLQGSLNAEAASRAGRSFCIHKATEGTTFVDGFYQDNARAIYAAGMARGAYHFARPLDNEPGAEAVHFLGHLLPSRIGDILALDLEDPPEGPALPTSVGLWAGAWLSAVEHSTGAKPLIYTNRAIIDRCKLGALGNMGYGLWLADWRALDPTPPDGWPFVAFWQFNAGEQIYLNGPRACGDFFNGSVLRIGLYGAK